MPKLFASSSCIEIMATEEEQAAALQIDGSILEGGGQILRNCVAYAAILQKPICIANIRGGREKPGLKQQHLAGMQLAANLCGAETTGLRIGSREITFFPNRISHGEFTADIGTAGACTLLAQIALPIALFAPQPTNLVLRGGTNVPLSPPVEYLEWILLPTLSCKFGVEGIQIDCVKPGFMPSGGGEVQIRVPHQKRSLSPVALDERGRIKSCTVFLSGCCTEGFEKEMRDEVAGLGWGHGAVRTVSNIRRNLREGGPVQVLFVVESENEHRIGGSALGFESKKRKGRTGGGVVRAAFEHLGKQLEKEVCVDEYLQDQVVIFMALCEGTSRMKCGEITLHTKTAMHFAALMTGAVFEVNQIDGGGVNIVSCTGTYSGFEG